MKIRVESIPESILTNPLVTAGFKGYAEGSFSNPDATYVFWANDIEFHPDGSTTHFGRIKAQEYRDRKNLTAPRSLWLMEDFERERGLPPLDKITAPPPLADAIFATTSYSYARSIDPRTPTATIAVASVKGAFPSSVFREIELDQIMNNPKIERMCIVSRSTPPDGIIPIPSKREAYHILRDEWLNSNIERFRSHLDGSSRPIDPTSDGYKKALNNLADEIAMAERCKTKRFPFSKGNDFLERSDTMYTNEDRAKEAERVAKVARLRADHSELDRLVLEKLGLPESLTFKQSVIAQLKEEEARKLKVANELLARAEEFTKSATGATLKPDYQRRLYQAAADHRAEAKNIMPPAELARLNEERKELTRLKGALPAALGIGSAAVLVRAGVALAAGAGVIGGRAAPAGPPVGAATPAVTYAPGRGGPLAAAGARVLRR